MIKEDSLRFRSRRIRRYQLMLVPCAALVLIGGAYLTNHGGSEKAGRPVTTLTGEDSGSNAKIIDKEQIIDLDTFSEKDDPMWPLIEELRKTAPQIDSTAPSSTGD
ncbi:hypothetical protein [Sphaerisporangium perillae]|uniref:hypothetical protein n=1 Tax=Sphaerisporangium perillae TaxID=2935860 RepID=UPI002010024F|nr:hypothetical protein [Sphaerisporangium perillae]